MQNGQYFDLTADDNDINTLVISQSDHFNCGLADNNTGEEYLGFVIAKSPEGNRLTICDVNFKRSTTDDKFQPRLTFRRVKSGTLDDVTPPASSDHIRIPFAHGADGYRNFWKMIFFLYKFKGQVDFGDFEGRFQVMSKDQVAQYLGDKQNIDSIKDLAASMNIEVSAIMRPASTLKVLHEARNKLQEFIDNDASETDVQNWIDEDDHMHRRERCVIFGLEYIDFKREGNNSSKRFDVLTRVGEKDVERVLIELKCPSDDIFDIKTTQTANGSSEEYHLHSKIARAIPQILEYRSTLENKNPGDPELTALGINEKIKIKKCIIIVGKNSNDQRWIQNRANLSGSLSSVLEIWTFDDLLNKLDSTITNIEQLSPTPSDNSMINLSEIEF
jgi:hypothetical protein